jgi:hypothetical protein
MEYYFDDNDKYILPNVDYDRSLTDDEILELIPIYKIERFLRKKKLENINKNKNMEV